MGRRSRRLTVSAWSDAPLAPPIESGQARSFTDLAEQEGVADAYVCRLLPLTCLAPDIVEAILDGRQSKSLRLAEMLEKGSLAWEEQRVKWGGRDRMRHDVRR